MGDTVVSNTTIQCGDRVHRADDPAARGTIKRVDHNTHMPDGTRADFVVVRWDATGELENMVPPTAVQPYTPAYIQSPAGGAKAFRSVERARATARASGGRVAAGQRVNAGRVTGVVYFVEVFS